jgi:membrane fusion protein, multidrug efflux system
MHFHLVKIVIVAALAAVAIGCKFWLSSRGAENRTTELSVPVSVTIASQRDMPVYLSGLGTVQALNTVPVHSQVDGKLIEIAFIEGQELRIGDIIGKLDPRLFQAALDQAIGKKRQDAASLISAEKDMVRATTLMAKSFETQKVVDQQQAKVDALKAAIAADEATIEGASTQLDYTTITSPINGRAGIRHIDLGNIVHAGDVTPLVVLTQTHPAAVVFTLPEAHLDALRSAMVQGSVEVTAFDRNNDNQLATGRLLLIDGTIDQTTATMRLKALFPNDSERLWPGAFVNARVLIETRRNAITVPSIAVQRGPKGLYVWEVRADSIARMRPIAIGPMTDDLTIITAGVDLGDRIVTEGTYKLLPGVKVTITPPTEPPAPRRSS